MKILYLAAIGVVLAIIIVARIYLTFGKKKKKKESEDDFYDRQY